MFDLSQTTKEFRERVRHIARTEIAPHAAETDRSEQYPWHCIEVLKREGLMGMTIPTRYGGKGAPTWTPWSSSRRWRKPAALSAASAWNPTWALSAPS